MTFIEEVAQSLSRMDVECEIENTGGHVMIAFVRVDERWILGVDAESVVLYDGPWDGTGDNERLVLTIPERWTPGDVATFVWARRSVMLFRCRG